uniref:Uncharacterized protein n=1 Tax=Glossina pallidipes TaxID=7398 RepID=A0A1B0AGN7_GLOPL
MTVCGPKRKKEASRSSCRNTAKVPAHVTLALILTGAHVSTQCNEFTQIEQTCIGLTKKGQKNNFKRALLRARFSDAIALIGKLSLALQDAGLPRHYRKNLYALQMILISKC